jgi:hypothetical protein
VPELLIMPKPVQAAQPEAALPKAALQLVAGSGAGARARSGALAGSLAGGRAAGHALPRVSWSTVPGGTPARGGYQPISRTQFDQMTLINPVSTGGLGPHPEREPEPV